MKQELFAVLRRGIDGFLAGMLISLGGAVYLACNLPDLPYAKYIGALFFSMALLVICMKGFALYTGKIGLVIEKHTKEDISVMLLGLFGNLLGTVAFGYLIAFAIPSLKDAALSLCTAKLGQGYLSALIRAFLCGILVFLAVDLFRSHKSVLGIVMCIPVFIMSGYEHSIADLFYFAASGIVSWQAFFYLWLIILGNSLGGLFIPALKCVCAKKEPAKAEQKEAPEGEEERKSA